VSSAFGANTGQRCEGGAAPVKNEGNNLANEKNLKSFTSEQSREEAVRNGQKGGINSGEARRKKKALREYLDMMLSSQPDARRKSKLLSLGLNEEDINREASMVLAVVQKAEKGDVFAFREVRELIGDEDVTKGEREAFSLPATALAAPFLSVYRDIREHGHSEYLLKGGRGSTKSSFAALALLELLIRNSDMHAAVCRKVKDTLRDSVYAQLVWAIGVLGLDNDFTCRVSPMEIIYKPTGQKIYFRGADDPGKLKSIKPPFGYIGILWFEELDQFSGDKEVRNIEQSVIRGGDMSFVFKTFNPPQTAANWANKYAKIPKPGRLDHHSTYLDVPKEWLGQKFIDDAEFLKSTSPKAYEHEYMGEANGTGGAVFDNVTLREITDEEMAGFDRIYRGVDWGWYPDPFRYHAMHYHAAERRLYIFDEISGNKLSNARIAELFEAHGITGEDKITADSGGEGKKSVADFREKGYFMRGAIKGPGSVEYSMKWLSSLTESIIDPVRCPEAAAEFMEYEYERNREGEVISGYPDRDNHSIDAARYALEEVWRRRGQ